MNAKEEWRDVVGYEGLYEVSNLGSVASKQKTVMAKNGTTRSYPRRKLKQYENSSGYMRVHLCKDGSSKMVLVHRIVAMAFVDNPSSKPFVNHLDENKQNNRADNLEWVTNDENLNYGTGRLKNAISESVPVLMIDGDKRMVFQSATFAERAGYASSNAIQNCCAGRQKTAGGFRWQYLDLSKIEVD